MWQPLLPRSKQQVCRADVPSERNAIGARYNAPNKTRYTVICCQSSSCNEQLNQGWITGKNLSVKIESEGTVSMMIMKPLSVMGVGWMGWSPKNADKRRDMGCENRTRGREHLHRLLNADSIGMLHCAGDIAACNAYRPSTTIHFAIRDIFSILLCFPGKSNLLASQGESLLKLIFS